jgi:serine/threonine protein kinase, bacterial
MIDSIAPTTLIQDRYYILRVLRPLEFGWLYSVVDRGITPVQRQPTRLPLCFLEEFRVPESLTPHLEALAEQLRSEMRQVRKIKILGGETPDYDEVIISGDRLFLKQFYVDHFSYGQVLEDRVLTGEGEAFLSESEAWELLDAIEPMLKSLHHQGLSHNNLSPETIVWQVATQKPGLMHFGSMRSVIQRVSLPLHTLDFEASVLHCPMQTDWVNLAETVLTLLGDPDWNHLSLQLATRLRALLEASPQSKLPALINTPQLVYSGIRQDVRQSIRQDVGQKTHPSIRQDVRQQRAGRSRRSVRLSLGQHLSQRFRKYFVGLPSLRQDPLLWGMALVVFGLSGLLGYRILMAQTRNPAASESLPQPSATGPTAFPLTNSPDPNLANPDLTSTPPILSDELKTQLRSLQVPENWFTATVDEMLGQSNVAPDDDRWKSSSKTLIQALEKLPPESRQNIGSYRRADFDQWLSQATSKSNAAKPTSKQIEDQSDAKFFELLPDRKGKSQNPRQLGQLWYAIAHQILKMTN